MLIQCTKKLLTELKIKPATETNENPLFSWHANLLTLNRRKTIVLVNDSNRYVVILYGIKAKDLKNLDNLIKDAMREVLLAERIKAEIVEKYLSVSPEAIYAKTANRTLVARMNNSCEIVGFFENEIENEKVSQTSVSLRVNRQLVGDGKGDYFRPNEEIQKNAWKIICRNALKLSIFMILAITGSTIWRLKELLRIMINGELSV